MEAETIIGRYVAMKESRFPFVMKSIAAVTTVVTLVLLLIYQKLPHPTVLSAAISFGTTAYHFVMRLAVGYIVPSVTGYNFNYRRPWFLPRKWEAHFYKKLNLKHWKGNLPTYAPSQFSLEENSMERVIQNMCGAEVVHEIIMVLSFLPLLTVPVFGSFPVFLITSTLAALYDSIFVMAQRFNRPRLVRIFEKQEAKRS